jgi:hypothetical protein
MRRMIGARTRLWLGSFAALGVVLTHSIAYRLAVPNPHVRQVMLDSSGHGFWPIIVAVALGAFVAGLAGLVAGHLSGGPDQDRGRRVSAIAARLMILQAIGFASLEGLERLLAVGGLEGFLTDPVLLLGLIIQAGLALLGALLVVFLGRAVDFFVSLVRPRWTESPVVLPIPVHAVVVPRTRPVAGGATLRGPPAASRLS